MTIRRASNDMVRGAVRAAVAYLGEEERWVLLQRWLERETAGKGEAAKRSLRLEALRSIVCPRVGDREWDDILREHPTVRWSDELRRANALAVLSSGGRHDPSRDSLLSASAGIEAPTRRPPVIQPHGDGPRLASGRGCRPRDRRP